MIPYALPDDELAKIHATALKRFKMADNYYSDIIDRAQQDVRFSTTLDGQWSGKVKSARKRNKKPQVSIPLTNRFCERLAGDIKMQDLEPKVTSADDTQQAHELSTLFGGIMADIHSRTNSRGAINHAVEQQITGGFGYLILESGYADAKEITQELRIERVTRLETILIDPAAEEPTGSDAEYGFRTFQVPIEDHMSAEYADDNWPKVSAQMDPSWYQGDNLQLVDYYTKYTMTGHQLPNGQLISTDDHQEALEDPMLDDENKQTLMAAEEEEHEIWLCCKMDGKKVLQQTVLLGAKRLPIVRVPGKQVMNFDKLDYWGLTPYVRDLQNELNYQSSVRLQLTASAPVNVWQAPTGSGAEGNGQYANLYSEAANGSSAVLPFNAWTTSGGAGDVPRQLPAPQRLTNMPDISSCLAAEAAIIEQMRTVTGIYDMNQDRPASPESARTLIIRDRSTQSIGILFAINTRIALEQIAQLEIDCIPYYYLNGDRNKVRIRDLEGHSAQTDVSQFIGMDPELIGELLLPSSGKGYSSLQLETADRLLALLPSLAPNQSAAIMDQVFTMLDLQGADAMSARIRRTLPPEIVADTQNPDLKDPAQVQSLLQGLQAQLTQLKQQNDVLVKEKQCKYLELLSSEKIAILEAKTKVEIANLNNEATVKVAQGKMQVEKIIHDVPGADAQNLNVMPTDPALTAQQSSEMVDLMNLPSQGIQGGIGTNMQLPDPSALPNMQQPNQPQAPQQPPMNPNPNPQMGA